MCNLTSVVSDITALSCYSNLISLLLKPLTHSLVIMVCLLISLPEDNLCLDYLHVERTVYNYDYCTCGRVGVSGQTFPSLDIPRDGTELEEIMLYQRSNTNCRGKGAMATVSCTEQPSKRKRRATCNPTYINPQLRSTLPNIPPTVSPVTAICFT